MYKKITLSLVAILSIVGFFAGPTATVSAQTGSCTSWTVEGTVTPNGSPTTAWFEWGTSASLPYKTPDQGPFNNNSSFSETLDPIQDGTTYYYKAVARNEFGTASGPVKTFTTPTCQQATAPVVSIYASPASISSGNSTTITWSATNNPTSCTANSGTNGWAGSKNTSGSFGTGSLTNDTSFSISCSNAGGTGSASTTVYVATQQATAPVVTIYASPTSVSYNGTSNITWSATNNPTSCTANGGTNGWAGSKNTSGSFSTGALTGSTTYGISCTNAGGVGSSSTTVSVGTNNQCTDPNANNYGGSLPCTYPTLQLCYDSSATNYLGTLPCRYPTNNLCYDSTAANYLGTSPCRYVTQQPVSVNLTADSTYLTSGTGTNLRWNPTNATSCYASGGTGSDGWTGSKGTYSGAYGGTTFYTGALYTTTTYSMNCSNSTGGYSTGSVTISVANNNYGTCSDSSATNYRGALPCTYTQRCTDTNATNYNAYGACTYQTTYINKPYVTIYANPATVSYNGASYITWSTTNNATSCYASGGSVGWTGNRSVSGTFYTGNLTGDTTFTISCSNSAGSSNASTTVYVRNQQIFQPVVVTPAPIVRQSPTSLVLINSTVDRNQPIVPSIDNTNPKPGDEITYTVNYQNVGTGSITNLRLQMNLPLEVDYLFSNPTNPTISGNTLVFSLGTLRANGQGVVTVRVRVRDNIPPGTTLNFPATLSYIDPSGFPQSVSANAAAQVWSQPQVQTNEVVTPVTNIGANALFAGFLPTTFFGWLVLLILLLILVALVRHIYNQVAISNGHTVTTSKVTSTTTEH